MAFKEWFIAEGEYQWNDDDPYGTAEMIWNASAQVHTAAEREKWISAIKKRMDTSIGQQCWNMLDRLLKQETKGD